MKRSKFNLSHYRLQSFKMGELEPLTCLEVLPGDSIRHSLSALIRVSPLVSPVMHPVEFQVFAFFVPNRIVWTNWEAFIANPDSGFTVPQVTVISGAATTTAYFLARSLGLGSAAVGAVPTYPTTRSINALPLRAFNLVWNEFFRDQDVDTPLVVATGNGPDTATDYNTRRARWRKDYFTVARAAPQKGSSVYARVDAQEAGLNVQLGRSAAGANTAVNIESAGGGAGTDITFGASIAEWRLAMSQQRFREHRNRFGSRYEDYLRWLGVTPADSRLQRPEYLGGGRQVISFSEVLATAEGTSTVVGDQAGHGIGAIRTRPWNRFFSEHGHVIVLGLARPVGVYVNGNHRNWFRSTYTDYWQKEEEIRGDQPVLKKEVNNAEADASANNVFGYQQRYEEYRRMPSSVAGEFSTTLDTWHYGRDWDAHTGPTLNSTFLECLPTTRVYADAVDDNLRLMVNHSVVARRLVSKFARV